MNLASDLVCGQAFVASDAAALFMGIRANAAIDRETRILNLSKFKAQTFSNVEPIPKRLTTLPKPRAALYLV